MSDYREIADLIRPEPHELIRLGVITSANFTGRPPTLTIGEGEFTRPMRFLGSIRDYQTGQTVLWLNRPGAPIILAPVPIMGDDPVDPWHEVGTPGNPGFEGGWGNHVNASIDTVAFYKQNDGWARLKGTAQKASGVTSLPIFTLPEGYRPPFEVYATAHSIGVTGRLRITTGGQVALVLGGGIEHVVLDGITFPTHWNQSAWRVPRLLNNWRWDPNLPGSTVEFFIRDDGWVWTKGGLTAGDVNTVFCTLPQEAYLRRGGLAFCCFTGNAFSVGIRVDVQYTGDMYYHPTTSFDLTLGNISYFAGQADSVVTWTAPTLLNGWVPQPPSTLRSLAPGYYKDHFGVVHLQGGVNGAGSTSNTILNLPPGYRPGLRQIFNSIGESNSQGRVDVYPDGNVNRVSGLSGFLSLSDVSFRAMQ